MVYYQPKTTKLKNYFLIWTSGTNNINIGFLSLGNKIIHVLCSSLVGAD